MVIKNSSHPEIIRGFIDPTEEDIQQAMQGTELEREWFSDVPGFETNADILTAYEAGKLVKIGESANYRPIGRFLNPELHGTYPPFLPFAAHALLEVVSERWRQQANKLGVPEDVRLAITSMTRSIAYQRNLVAGGKLAVEDSSHTKVIFGAVDADLGGYYQGFGDDVTAVSLREPNLQAPISRLFTTELGATPAHPRLLGPAGFDPRVPEALLLATAEIYDIGAMNRLEEFAGTDNSCLHMVPHPDFMDFAA